MFNPDYEMDPDRYFEEVYLLQEPGDDLDMDFAEDNYRYLQYIQVMGEEHYDH